MKKILVTGGAGYIGSHVCELLAEHGYNILIADHYGRKDSISPALLGSQIGDITNEAFLDSTIAAFGPDAVIHLAASCNPRESITHPQAYHLNNTLATTSLLNLMVKHGVNQLIFASSASIYAEQQENAPYSETCAANPTNPYSASKWMSEQIIHDFSAKHGIRHVIMRHFNPSGFSATRPIEDAYTNNRHTVAELTRVALGKSPVFKFFGTDYPTPDGSSIRDYVHVSDVASAHLYALRYLEQQNDSLTVNIGTGKEVSLKEMLAATERYCGHSLPVEYLPRCDLYQAYLVADTRRAAEMLGWTPRHSSIENIIRTTFRWFTGENEWSAPSIYPL